VIEQVMEDEKFVFLQRGQCPKAPLEIIALCHPWEYIERIRSAVPQTGLVQLDDDTVLSAGSFEASLRAAGGAIFAVDEVITGKTKNAFVAIRPAQAPARSLSVANTTTSSTLRFERAMVKRYFVRRSRSRFFPSFKNSSLTLLSSQLASMHTDLTLWQTLISPRLISAGQAG
jgi:hypothetical protein